MKKITKLSHNEKAAARAAALLKAGVTLTVPAFRGYYTAGAYTPAVGPGGFAVYGALKAVTSLRLSAEEEYDGADLSLHRIGATPEREVSW